MDAERLRRIAIEAMRSRGLLAEFSPQALEEAHNGGTAGRQQRGDIRDSRHLPWFSIDNDDTQDLDQLTMAEEGASNTVRLRVAIADVDARVAAGSAVDRHAAANTTSVYTAAGVFPMLPEVLSNGLTSLHEGVERLAVVVDMVVDEDGIVSSTDIHRAVVSNHAKLAYDAVAAWLDGSGPPPVQIGAVPGLAEQIRMHDAVAQRLRQWRQRRGALNAGTSQARPVFVDGRLVDLRADPRNRAKDLIADVMIAANSATARFLRERGLPSLRRYLQAPRRWDRIVALASQHGAELPAQPDAPALDRFLRERRAAAPDRFPELSLAVIKLVGSGEYIAEPPSDTEDDHFGLAVTDYAHSTAPNRRFPDLVTQRLLKAALAREEPPYSLEELGPIARHCTAQEDRASAVERQVLKAAGAFLLRERIGERFDAIVTGTPAKGTFARISTPLVEGRVVRGFEGLEVGDAVRLRLASVDPEQGFIDFERV